MNYVVKMCRWAYGLRLKFFNAMVTSAVSFAAARRRVYVCRAGAATGCTSPDRAIAYE